MKAWHLEAKRLRAEGHAYREIGAQLGMSKSAVWHAVKVGPSTTLEDRERRQAAVLALRRLGWAKRRIALTLGIADNTVRCDLARADAPEPERVLGRDGRFVPARRGRSG